MSIGIKVGPIISEVGTTDFFFAFFSTIFGLLEDGVPGSRYPIVSKDFYNGHLDPEKLAQALIEIQSIRNEFMKYPATSVIWNIEDRSKNPPWGNNVSSQITSMANYFVTSTGRDLIELLIEVFSHAIKRKKPIDIVKI